MKIDRSKLKKSSTEVPADCRTLIEKLKSSEDDLLAELRTVKTWTFGKCELYHWSDILDLFDDVLEKACKKETEKKWTLACDVSGNEKLKTLLLEVLRFTALLIEHSFSRHLYNSMEHLTTLLASCDMTVVLGVLNLLYVFSKRSNFITRLNPDKKQALVVRLTHLAESWGGKENGFGLAECCKNLALSNFPPSATTLHFEFYTENKDEKSGKKGASNSIQSIHMDNVDKAASLPSTIMEQLENYSIPADKQVLLYTHIRLAHLFSNYEARVQCVQARLQAIAILVYSNAIQENMNVILYPGLIEELVDIVELKEPNLVDIKAAALRTLTSIIHLERNPKLNSIIDATGASSYHGFLPVLVRTCIQHMIDPEMDAFPQQYATALFSFLYHLASYENGVEALVSCGMMEALLKVINWYGEGQEHITVSFVTRAVRVIDLITNLDMAAFQAHGGLLAFINRLENEVSICRKEQPFVIRPARREASIDSQPESPPAPMETDMTQSSDSINAGASTSLPAPVAQPAEPAEPDVPKTGVQCFPQRAALLKSMLNFLKKAIPDTAFAESIRHLMDGSLPKSLKHIISNAEYYGPSLFLLATDVVTVYVFQEPSLLSSLQDNGLTDVVLNALLIKDVPATREVLASLPNVFSALCLNTRGLEAFVECRPFDRLFKVLLSPDYLPAMRRRRSSDPFGDTASNLGNAMDELMRHQPSLRTDATKAIIKLLEEVCAMGRDTKYICQKQQPKAEQNMALSIRSPQPADTGSSDEDEEEEELPSTASQSTSAKPALSPTQDSMQSQSASPDRQAIPLMDYVLNVMKFVEAILSNNSTDDHCREFVTQKGLLPLMGILGLPNLPIDFPASPACQAVASVCKAILSLSREPQVLKQGLLHLNEVLQKLEPLHKPLDPPGGSVLLRELASVANIPDATLSPQATPLLHALSAAHAYIMMFVHVCRMGQVRRNVIDIRTISVSHWGSELGLQVLKGLSRLYTSLVWESTVLLALCSEDILPPGCEFGKEDMDKILPKDQKSDKDPKEGEEGLTRSVGEMGSNGVSAAMESLTTSETPETPMEVVSDSASSSDKDTKKSKLSPTLQAQIKQLKPLLSVSSRLGRALAELFGLLVKLCVGTPVRQRRSHQTPPTPTTPTPAAQAVAKALTKLLANGLSWNPPPHAPVPKLRLTFLVCSVGFTSPMLFDEKKQPYHLMLQKFVSSGGQDALFQAFSWALSMNGKVPLVDGLEHPDLPDGSGEFIDAWLMLVEKMVNPKTVLESPHTLPTKSTQPGFAPFSPVQYLISTQKAAFNAVMNLWNKKPIKVYGSRMSESILAILCHIIKGEGIIKEYLAKEKEESAAATPGAQTPSPASSVANNMAAAGPSVPVPVRQEPEVNQAHLQQLMDMGFTREHCMDALLHTTSLEQATDYLLNHPPPALQVPGLGMDMDMSEEDQMMRAIAMSLGENVVMSTDQEEPKKEEKKEEEDEEQEKQELEEPLDKSVLDNFTQSVVTGCMQLLDTLPETVYRVCDLMIVITQRNGNAWRDESLATLVQQVFCLAHQLLAQLSEGICVKDSVDKVSSESSASQFANRLHLLSLLFEEMMMPCAEAVENGKFLDLLIQVLNEGQEYLSNLKDPSTPKWMAPLLLLLDLFEKVSVISKRKSEAMSLIANSHTWKWFDDSSGRWCKYSVGNNKTIDDAYRSGDSNVRFQAGRRRYTVQFSSLVQVNEETGNRRPIMLSFPTAEEKPSTKEEPKDSKNNTEASGETPKAPEDTKMETETVEEKEKPQKTVVQGFTDQQITSIIKSVVSLLSVPVDPDTLHASLRLMLRLTREHKHAVHFAELGGPKILLNLTQASAFQGFVSLATLLFRHILEEPSSLKYCMEKVMRNACSGIGSSACGVANGSIGSKEMHYVMRVLGPAGCRNPSLFAEVSKNTLQIALPPPGKILRDEDENRYTAPNAPQILKCSPTKQLSFAINQTVKEVVHDLLNALIVKYTWKVDENTSSSEVRPAQTLAEAIQEVVNEVARELNERQQQAMVRQNSSAEVPQSTDEGEASQSDPNAESSTSKEQKDTKSAEDIRKQRPLLPKSAILRLLSEIIKSYGNCTQLITQYTYHSGQTEMVSEECSVLAFVLDSLLPQCQASGDRDCPSLSRVFIASIASCNHSPEAQNSLVIEIKGALQRALAIPESSEKHSRLQALTGIISTIIEACPSPGQVPNQVFKGQQTVMNNMVKILIKRGLVTDLARIPHNLDLSSPYMAQTINSALKPLETLSRSVNQPLQSVTAKPKTPDDGSGPPNMGGTTIAANNNQTDAQGVEEALAGEAENNVTIEDVTDHPLDLDDLEETCTHDAVEPDLDSQNRGGNLLDQVLDQFLNRGPGQSDNEILGDITMGTVEEPSQASHNEDESPRVIINVEVETDDIDQHDSQMVTQEISDVEDDADDHVQDDGPEEGSPDSASEGDDDDNDDADNDDHDDEDDDEDDEDDDEGSDMDADEDDYHDMDTTITPGYEDDFLFHMDDMFPAGNSTYPMGESGAQHIFFNDNSQIRTYQLPISVHDNDNGNDAMPSLPPAPSNVTTAHPLLMRQSDPHTVMGVARVHRGNRQRGSYRFNPNTQTLHVNLQGSGRQPNPPVILQRLLGPTTAADILQLTNTLTTQAGGPTHTRVVLANDDLRIISRPEEDLFEELFQDPFPESGSAGSGVLSCVPSTLTRWTEETKVLDGDSVHNCLMTVKPNIIESLIKTRDEELSERREKRKKAAEEDAAKKEKEKQNKPEESGQIDSSSGTSTSVTTSGAVSAANTLCITPVVPSHTSTPNPPPPPVTTTTENLSRQISVSEAVAAAERLASAMVEEVLAPAITTTAASLPSGQTAVTPSVTQAAVSTTAHAELTDHLLAGQGLAADTITPANQPVPLTTPSAPRRAGDLPTSNLASLLLFDDSVMEATSSSSPLFGLGTTQGDEVGPTATPTSSSDSTTGAQPQSDTAVTPEEVSNITSSDAVTVHSSASGSTEELATASGMNPPNTSGSTTSQTSVTSVTSSILSSLAEAANLASTSSGTPSTVAAAADSEGVDPSFLAALPDNIRQEVIAEQLRLQRIQQRAQQQAQNTESAGAMEVNAEFLAALPPAIQEEVLAQQRAEQARLAAQQQTQTNPETPVDPASFFATLPTSLRQQVLADMDDSMLAVLPPDLAAEAQELRREFEERHRRIVQERIFAQAGAASLSAILRHSGAQDRAGLSRGRTLVDEYRGLAGRLGSRYAIRAAPRGSRWAWGNRYGGRYAARYGAQPPANSAAIKLRGRHLLDNEALTCLLVLLFLDEPKLNTSRLHRVLRNLCYDGPTRTWVIRALLSIMQKTGECKLHEIEDKVGPAKTPEKGKAKKVQPMQTDSPVALKSDVRSQASWLSMSLEAALGCRANVFQIQRSAGKKHTNPPSCSVSIHNQAAPVVCRHVLDTLISLAKVFPSHFLPAPKAKEVQKCEDDGKETDNNKQKQIASGASSPRVANKSEKGEKSDAKQENKCDTNFWDLLVRLDNTSGSKKGKGMQKAHNSSAFENEDSTVYNSSPIGHLMNMLSHPVIRRSQLLTDRLLRLLGLVSIGLPDLSRARDVRTSGVTTATSNVIATTAAASSLLTAATITTSSNSAPTPTSMVQPSAPPATSAEAKLIKSPEEVEEEFEDESPILKNELNLAVQVLTTKSCSEEGLEDATNLLLQLSWANNATRNAVLELLLVGARKLGLTVCANIRGLLVELQNLNAHITDDVFDSDDSRDVDASVENRGKGMLPDRFMPGVHVVVSAPTKMKSGRELQLPSMSQLTCKTSSQQFFLRILKVIIQLREAARVAAKKQKRTGRELGNIAEAMAALEAEAEAFMEVVSHRSSTPLTQQAQPQQAAPTQVDMLQGSAQSGASDAQPPTPGAETPMEVDQPGSSKEDKDKKNEETAAPLPRLSEQLSLEELWQTLGDCLSELAKTPDQHAVLILQPAVEAFFIVHAGEKEVKPVETHPRREDQLAHLNAEMAPPSPSASNNPAASAETSMPLTRENSVASVSSLAHLPPDAQKFLRFAETHRTVLNQILRQSTTPLADGPFSVLVDHTRILDFDVKRRYFRQELERLDEGLRREDLPVHVRRENVFEDSFRELFRRSPEEWKQRFYIVFEGEEGQDAGGLLREWYLIISREIFNPNYALFKTSPGDRVTYTINPSSHCNSNHLSYFKFVGRIIAKAVYDNKLLECYFTRSFYKHLLGQPVKYTDMESEDYAFYQGLVFLLEHGVADLGYDLTFATEIMEFGVMETRDIIPNGRNVPVSEENKREYVKLVCQMKMTGAIRKQLNAFLEGFYDIIPKKLVSIFNEQELELLISGLPTVDIDDLKANSEYHKYQPNSLQIQWFWRALRSFDQAERANFLQFVTGTSKVPLQGFAFLEGMNGIQKFQIHRDDRSTDRLPTAHTCFNQLDLPAYETYDKLRHMLLLAVSECSEGFGLA
ncbi:E3 ubiquitin-protein ligase HUWE1-like isoform X1 [Haliotis rufescens]|uniref:E3 ubiquitin-protein ligase HUWE1-like isoform X1 n=1 Tax=Haliotis rufescens TaxID=6454 RepID=UPI001EB08990|nr:E3 ubiquitin-protein ligase HUWE1-like isoform X1 [Haliotis rufescens]